MWLILISDSSSNLALLHSKLLVFCCCIFLPDSDCIYMLHTYSYWITNLVGLNCFTLNIPQQQWNGSHLTFATCTYQIRFNTGTVVVVMIFLFRLFHHPAGSPLVNFIWVIYMRQFGKKVGLIPTEALLFWQRFALIRRIYFLCLNYEFILMNYTNYLNFDS